MTRANLPAAVVAAVLAALVWTVYAPVTDHEFLAYDDVLYVTESARVQAGLSAETVLWSFTATEAGNWHPLVWLSHAADVEFFGLDAGRHHQTSVAIHAIATALLFAVLYSLTGSLLGSALAAALFGLHPLRLESVAWIAERKDVLCGLFTIAALGAELRYARAPSLARAAVVALCFGAALMSKAMAVTLPVALLLFDVWPLGRLRGGPRGPTAPLPQFSAGRLIAEKLPLLVFAAIASAVAVRAQRAGGALAAVEGWPLGARLENAATSYWIYLRKTLWPSDLAVFYPYPPNGVESGDALLAGLAFASVSAVALFVWRSRPAFAFGWFWFVGTLVPVIGIVTVGEQALADRYTYVPHMGFAVVLAFALSETSSSGRGRRRGLLLLSMLALFVCVAATRVLLPHWKSDLTLFARALDETTDSRVAHLNYGNALEGVAPRRQQIGHFERAVELGPRDANAHYHLGRALALGSDLERGVEHYKISLALDAEQPRAWNNLGSALGKLGDVELASAAYRRALELEPGHATSNFNLAMARLREGDTGSALEFAQRYAQTSWPPADHEANVEELARAFARAGDIGGACELIGLSSSTSGSLQALLGGLEWHRGNERSGIAALEQARKLDALDSEVANDLAWMLATATDASLRDPARALGLAAGAVVPPPAQRDAAALDTLAAVHAVAGDFEAALERVDEAIGLEESAGRGTSGLVVRLREHAAAFRAQRPLHEVRAARAALSGEGAPVRADGERGDSGG